MATLRKQQTTALSTPRQIARFCCGLSSPLLYPDEAQQTPGFWESGRSSISDRDEGSGTGGTGDARSELPVRRVQSSSAKSVRLIASLEGIDRYSTPSCRAHHDNKCSSHFSTKGETLPPPSLQTPATLCERRPLDNRTHPSFRYLRHRDSG